MLWSMAEKEMLVDLIENRGGQENANWAIITSDLNNIFGTNRTGKHVCAR